MKTAGITLITLTLSLTGFCQNIADFFATIPDTSVLRLTEAERKEIVKHSMDNRIANDAYEDMRSKGIKYAFETVDIKNGYLKLIGAFEGHIQMCYWNLKNGNKLIAIYQEGCGPVCYIEQFDFYEYNGLDFKPINQQLIIPDIYKKFFKDNLDSHMEEMERMDISATLLFDLPRIGKNIIAKWGNEDSQETYKKYGRGDRMILTWDDGRFKIGDIYWE